MAGEPDQEPPPPDGGRPAAEAVIAADGRADVEDAGICELRIEAGVPQPGFHVHDRHVESFYVLDGELALMLGERELRAGAGTWVQLAPGLPHAVLAPSTGAARVLNVHTPNCDFGASDQRPVARPRGRSDDRASRRRSSRSARARSRGPSGGPRR